MFNIETRRGNKMKNTPLIRKFQKKGEKDRVNKQMKIK